MFDSGATAGNKINVSFGGISLYYVDPRTSKLKKDEGLPFINSITATFGACVNRKRKITGVTSYQ